MTTSFCTFIFVKEISLDKVKQLKKTLFKSIEIEERLNSIHLKHYREEIITPWNELLEKMLEDVMDQILRKERLGTSSEEEIGLKLR